MYLRAKARLVKDPSDTGGEQKRRKAVFGKPWPFLSLKIAEANVDMARGLILSADAQRIRKVAGGIWIGETAYLQAKVTDAKERLRIAIELLMSNDVAGTDQISVFADIGGGTPRIVNLPFRSEMLAEIIVGVKCQALNISLAKVGTKDESTETGLDLTGARSGWNGLPVRQGRHA